MQKRKRGLLEKMGPGIITGASDDDPSGILTYIQSGVVLGLRSLWVVLLTLPLMYGLQEMCGRIGYVTNKGLTKILKEYFPRYILFPIVAISVVVIVINIGADILAVSTVLEALTSISRVLWLGITGIVIILATIFLPYKKLAGVLKWLALTLLFYVAVAFAIHINWGQALQSTFSPSVSFNKEWIILIAALFGTTISPYLFFWQANEESEERQQTQRENGKKRFYITKHSLGILKKDTLQGMVLSNVVMWFIILVSTHIHSAYGITQIQTLEDASLALAPLLGPGALFIFSLGIIGTGLLAVPVLAGSIGYMVAETFDWQEGLNKKFLEARAFYWSIALSVILGIAMTLIGIEPIQMLIYTAVFYALITPLLIAIIMKVGNNKKIMGQRKNGPLSNILGTLALLVTAAITIAYLVQLVW